MKQGGICPSNLKTYNYSNQDCTVLRERPSQESTERQLNGHKTSFATKGSGATGHQ
jgi:hypothetical protein